MHQLSVARLLVSAAALGVMLTTLATARAAVLEPPDRTEQIAGREVAVWLPPQGAGPAPLVLFSHGFAGCKTQSSYLMHAIAQHGFVVAAPDHEDNHCAAEAPPDKLPEAFYNRASWSPNFYRGRRDDLAALPAALEADPAYAGLIDPDRIVLVGHSLGGYTVLALAGAWPSWQMDGIDGVVALAPFAIPFLNGGALGSLSASALFQGGTQDFTTAALKQFGIFAATSKPACEVVYRHADHFAWTDLETKVQDAMAAATVAFLDQVFAGHGQTLSAAALASPETDGNELCK
jgi:dienelactone hydrolase